MTTIPQLTESVKGRVILPTDPDYDRARTVFRGGVDRHPAVIVRVADSDASSRVLVDPFSIYGAPEEAPVHEAWIARLAAELDQGDRGAYVNFLRNEGSERIRAAYPGDTYSRLAAIKARYDPTNLFRLNQNIAPAGA